MTVKKVYPKGKMGMTQKEMPMGSTKTMQKMMTANPFAISPGAAMAAYQKEEGKKTAQRAPSRRVIRRRKLVA